MKEIKLSQGKVALVDKEDYERLSKHKWNYNGRYAKRTVNQRGKYETILMHRFIMNTPETMYTDHINGNKLDNRKSNLRVCTPRENSWNGRGHHNNPSKYKGVNWNPQRNNWRVRVDGKYHGSFKTEKEAAKKYNELAKKIYGEYAFLNDIK